MVVMHDGIKMLEIPLWRSYLAGCILLGVAPCTAMVLVWGYLARGNDGLTLVMVAINSFAMLLLYGLLGGFLLGIGRLPVPWEALLLSIEQQRSLERRRFRCMSLVMILTKSLRFPLPLRD